MLASGVFLPVLQAVPNPVSPIVLAALMLGLLIVILYYLFSRLLSSPQLEAFAREEFSQFVFTAFLFASFGILYVALSGISSAAICGTLDPPCDHMDVALYSLGLVRSLMMDTYFSLYGYEVVIGTFSTMGFYVPILITPFFFMWTSIQPLSGLEPLSNALVTVIESMGYLVGLAFGRERLVSFFRDITPTLLAIGFLMRTMPFSRKTGSSIIAIAFAGFFAYPLSITLSHYMMFGGDLTAKGMDVVDAPSMPMLCSISSEDVEAQNKKIGEDWEEVIGRRLYEDPDENIFDMIVGTTISLIEGIYDLFTEFLPAFIEKYNFNLLSPNFMPFIHFAYYFVIGRMLSLVQLAILVLITFVFEILLTVTAFRSVSQIIGGEIEILGLTKVA